MENYEKIKKIGRGTYGDVILVKHKKDNVLLALKKVVLENFQSSSSSGRGSRSSLKNNDVPKPNIDGQKIEINSAIDQ